MTPSRHLIVIAGGYIAGAVCYSILPGPYLPASLSPLARLVIAGAMPTAAAMTYAILRRLWMERGAHHTDRMIEATYQAIAFRVVLFVIGLHALLLTVLAGAGWVRPWAGRAVVILSGLALIGVGDLLPRTRPNRAIGIRTPRTLSDRTLWMHTHRVAGYLAVCLGTEIAAAGAFLGGTTLPRVVGMSAMAAVTVLVVSYRRYARA